MAVISITAANVVPSALAVIRTGLVAAATTITAGQAVYVTAAGTYGLCDNNASLLASTFAGIAVSGGSAGQTIAVVISDPALVLGGTTVTGTAILTSPTAGGITLTPGDNTTGSFVTVIGVGISTTTINMGLGFGSINAI